MWVKWHKKRETASIYVESRNLTCKLPFESHFGVRRVYHSEFRRPPRAGAAAVQPCEKDDGWRKGGSLGVFFKNQNAAHNFVGAFSSLLSRDVFNTAPTCHDVMSVGELRHLAQIATLSKQGH